MKNFESFLSVQLNEYLAYRESLGYSFKSIRSHLLVFDRYLWETEADWKVIQPSFFLKMRSNLTMDSGSVNKILSTARFFFQFLIRQGYLEENPLNNIPPLREKTVVPFIFSPEQTDQLLDAVCKRVRRSGSFFLSDLAIYIAILLLARCGMRISEPLRLRLHHYRKDDVTLYIEKTKFRKDRLIPVPKAVMTEIENYHSVRRHLCLDDQNPYLLAGKNQEPLKAYKVRSVFHQAVKEIGLEQTRKVIGNMNFNPPIPHSLRHSFAINTLRGVIERGKSAQEALPVLAAYMGHSEYKYTSVYLRVADAKMRKNLIDFSLWQKRKE